MSVVKSFNSLSNVESCTIDGVEYKFSHKINLEGYRNWYQKLPGFVFTSGEEVLVVSHERKNASVVIIARMKATSYYTNEFLESMFLNFSNRDGDDKYEEVIKEGSENLLVHYYHGKVVITPYQKYSVQL